MPLGVDSFPQPEGTSDGTWKSSALRWNWANLAAICAASRQGESGFGYNPEKAGEMAEWLKAAVC
jgi:hypothetical protein